MITDPRAEVQKALKEVGKELFLLYTPWPSWTVSGYWIAEKPATGVITATDDVGREVLSYVPPPLVADFMSKAGQTIVSRPDSHHTYSILTNGSNDP